MKKLTILLSATTLLTACAKDFECTCEKIKGSEIYVNEKSKTLTKTNKADAKSDCIEFQESINKPYTFFDPQTGQTVQGSKVVYDCSIKKYKL